MFERGSPPALWAARCFENVYFKTMKGEVRSGDCLSQSTADCMVAGRTCTQTLYGDFRPIKRSRVQCGLVTGGWGISPWASPGRVQPQELASAGTLLVPWLGQRPLLGYSSGLCPVRLAGQTTSEGSGRRNQVIRPGWAGPARLCTRQGWGAAGSRCPADAVCLAHRGRPVSRRQELT